MVISATLKGLSIKGDKLSINMPLELIQLYALKCLLQDLIWKELGDGIEYGKFVRQADHYYAEILQ